MARQEHDREDLMAEATALVRRVELAVPGRDEPVVAGFWRDVRMSIYFGGDPVYHFDSAGRLRKAFVGGKLYRASRAGLAQLTRQRSETESVLLRHDLSREQTEAFLQEMKQELDALAETFAARGVRVVRETPAGAEVAAKVYAQLQTLLDAGPQVAPSIGRR